jgi:hypothetical protein
MNPAFSTFWRLATRNVKSEASRCPPLLENQTCGGPPTFQTEQREISALGSASVPGRPSTFGAGVDWGLDQRGALATPKVT